MSENGHDFDHFTNFCEHCGKPAELELLRPMKCVPASDPEHRRAKGQDMNRAWRAMLGAV